MVLVSAKQCRFRILSKARSGLGEGASHDAMFSACSGLKASLGKRLRESSGSSGLGPNAHISESSEGSHAVALSGAESSGNSKQLSLIFRRLRISSVRHYVISIVRVVVQYTHIYHKHSLMVSSKEGASAGKQRDMTLRLGVIEEVQ
jgi:hypothetical protein